MDILAWRFVPSAAVLQQVAQSVETLTDEAAIERLFAAAIRRASLAKFQAAMTQANAPALCFSLQAFHLCTRGFGLEQPNDNLRGNYGWAGTVTSGHPPDPFTRR